MPWRRTPWDSCTPKASVPQDYIQSYAWFNLAGATGQADAKQVKDDLAKKMTPEQIVRGQELSTELDKK
jgi:hypothetical protein